MYQRKKSILFYFLLFSVFLTLPFLEFISYNLNTVKKNEELVVNFLTIKRLSIIYFFFVSILFFVLILLNNTKKNIFLAGLFLTSSYVIIFNYNTIKKIINENFFIYNSYLIKFSGYISLGIIFFIILVLFYFIKKNNKFIIKFLLIFFFLSILFESYKIIFPKKSSLLVDQNLPLKKLKLDGTKRKNIYYFILDAMPPTEDFDRIFNNDSSSYLKELEDNGFYEIKDSFSNYGSTYHNIGSILNLGDFEEFLKLNSRVPYKFLYPTVLRKNNIPTSLEYNLNEIGYSFKWIGNYHMNCLAYNRDYCIQELDLQKSIIFNYENKSFLNKTPLFPILSKLLNIFDLNFEKKFVFDSNNSLKNFTNYIKNYNIKKNNQFFLIHDLKTHWPYLMDSNCNFKHFKGRSNLKGIKNAINCSRDQILEISKIISKKDPEALVIFQSDHNWELSNINQKKYGKRNSFFNIIKLNQYCKDKIEQFNTHINTINYSLHCATESILNF